MEAEGIKKRKLFRAPGGQRASWLDSGRWAAGSKRGGMSGRTGSPPGAGACKVGGKGELGVKQGGRYKRSLGQVRLWSWLIRAHIPRAQRREAPKRSSGLKVIVRENPLRPLDYGN